MPEAATANTFIDSREGADPRQVRGQAISPCGAKTVQRTGNGSSRLQNQNTAKRIAKLRKITEFQLAGNLDSGTSAE